MHAWLPGDQEEGVQFLGTEVTDGWERPLGVGGQEEGVQFLGTGVTDGWELEVRLSPLEEQARSSTSPSAPFFNFWKQGLALKLRLVWDSAKQCERPRMQRSACPGLGSRGIKGGHHQASPLSCVFYAHDSTDAKKAPRLLLA